MRILVVDDDYVSRLVLKKLLSAYGDCDAVSNGELALSMIEAAHKEGIPYELISIDISMPEMNGHELLKRVRLREETIRKTKTFPSAKVLMVTISSDQQDMVTSIQEGCGVYLMKPVSAEFLRSSLKELGIEPITS